MPRTITKTVYTFRELLVLRREGKVAQKTLQRVRSWLTEGQTMYDWWEYIFGEQKVSGPCLSAFPPYPFPKCTMCPFPILSGFIPPKEGCTTSTYGNSRRRTQ